jgi:hypothetical protein
MCTASHGLWIEEIRAKKGATGDKKKDKPEVVCAEPHMAYWFKEDKS